MVMVCVIVFLWSVASSWAQTPQIRPVFGTRAGPSLLSVTDGAKCEIEVSGGGSCWTILDDVVTNNKLADMPALTLKGNPSGVLANPVDLTAAGVKMMLNLDQVTNTSDAQKWVLPKKLENTRLKKRVLTQADPIGTGFITIDADNFDIIKVAELSQATTFNPPTGTHDVGDLLFFEIFTTTQRGLTFSTATNGFIADANLALPTVSNAGQVVKYLFEWNGTKWSLAASSQTTTRGVLDECYRSNGPNTEPGFRACPAGGGGIAGTIGTIHLPVDAVKFPTSDAATVDGSETNARLLFDNAVRTCAYWGPFRMNADYASTPVFKFQYSMTSITSGGVAIDVQVMAVTPGDAADAETESYATVNTCTNTPVPATAGHMKEISCALTNNDTVTAGDLTKIRLCRNVANATDTAAGVMEALAASLEYVR